MKSKATLVMATFLLFASACVNRKAAVVHKTTLNPTLLWDSCGPGISYRVHLGTASRSYGIHLDAGTNTSLLLTNLKPGIEYYVSVTAISSNNQSGFSEEIKFTVSDPD